MSTGTNMSEPIRLLHVEDLAGDAELIWRELSRAGLSFQPMRVEEEASFLDRLVTFKPEIVLSDYSLPRFDGMRALELARQYAPDVPVIIVTGSQNEETAVACMRAGAADYVIKEFLSRLPGAIKSALRHRELESLRREAEQRFALFMQFLPARAYIRNGEGLYIFANEKLGELFGEAAADIVGKSLSDFVGATSALESDQNNALVLASGTPQLFEETIVVGGEEHTYLSSKFPIVQHDGSRLLGGTSIDITDRKRAAEAVLKSEREFRALAENLPDGVARFNRQRILIYVNRRVEAATGLPRDVFIGRSYAELGFPPALVQLLDNAIDRTFETNEVTHLEFAFDTPAGPRQFEARFVPESVAGNEQTVLTVARDVTRRNQRAAELRESEQQLLQAQKMEAVGRLAGGIAHDFNNVLMAILLQGNVLLRLAGGNEAILKRVQEILKAGHRAAALTKQLLAFSRNEPANRKAVSLPLLVRNLEEMLQRLVSEDVALHFELDQDCPNVFGDTGQFEQVVMNLVMNARDAMPCGGAIRIQARKAAAAEVDSAGGVHRTPYAVLLITDTGIGMDSSTQQRIFEPFFTTKSKDKGTGLGLSTVYGIVNQANGLIRVASEPGKGSTFSIFLPATVHGADRPASVTSHALEESLRGTETILLVEDDPLVRRILAETLQTNGYTVLEASDGAAALEIARQRRQIDLLLSDVVMPNANGIEVARTIAAGRPALRVVLMSGYADDALSPYGLDAQDAVLLHKPFTEERLLSVLRDVLAPLARA